MLLRWGPGGGVGVELCVACTLRVVEKAVRPSGVLRVEEGCMRGSRKDGRRSAMASLGRYTAAIVAVKNGFARVRLALPQCGAHDAACDAM